MQLLPENKSDSYLLTPVGNVALSMAALIGPTRSLKLQFGTCRKGVFHWLLFACVTVSCQDS